MIVLLGKPIKNWECIYEDCEASCCRTRREITLLDIKRIVEATGKQPEDFVSITTGYIPYTLKRKDGKCVFLTENYQCVLHDSGAKPILCKMYPFMLQKILYGDEPIMFISPVQDCPGYGRGPPFTKETLDEIKRQGKVYLAELRRIARYKKRRVRLEEILQKEL
ncbi:MAG: putative Fe-S oxidoreductase [Candidatus Bathyarchaeota archaeon B63]|nr:MAG: putative Fe-S oxidoreductase [Candidatus Bathyarchaeota archaeon B63]